MQKAKSTCDVFSLVVIADSKPKSFWMCLPFCSLVLIILLILVTNSFQSIERLMKRSMRFLYRSIIYYKAHCLCNLATFIFLNKQKGQRLQLLKPACELLMRNLNCMKAIMMLLFHSAGFWMRWVVPGLLWGVRTHGPLLVPTGSRVAGAGGRLGLLLVMLPCSQCETCCQSLLLPRCPKENASKLMVAAHTGSCGMWKRWKRFKVMNSPGWERAVSHLMLLPEQTSDVSALLTKCWGRVYSSHCPAVTVKLKLWVICSAAVSEAGS